MRLLVLGGTRFVGRCVVEEAVSRGDDVTVLNRGVTGAPPAGVQLLTADRRDPREVEAALGQDTWDAVIDTWSQEPATVRGTAGLLADRVGHYGYVSSRSVYRWPLPVGADESAPVVEGDAGSDEWADYASAKRGGELAVLETFEGRCLLARAGLILGPHEDIGRLPWWLGRIQRGGDVVAPGPADLALQYVDARDLARWLLDAAERGLTGAYNAVSAPGHTTMGELLDTCVEVVGTGARLVWVAPEDVAAAGVTGWSDLPIWVPPHGDLVGLHQADTSAARVEGLWCRPVRETVDATWRWLQEEGFPEARRDRPTVGVDPRVERRLLASARR